MPKKIPEKYFDWIDKNVPDKPTCLCKVMSFKMKEAFPELEVKEGVYSDPDFHIHVRHWWVCWEGIIIDPTQDQFPSGGHCSYKEPLDDVMPNYYCHNCASMVYNGEYLCDTCRDSGEKLLSTSRKVKWLLNPVPGQ